MKAKITFILAFFVTLSSGIFAAVKTISNNPSSPGQYTTLQPAIDAAALGDTLMVAGSTTSYGTVSITKPLVLVGAGYNNPYGNNTLISSINLNRVSQFLGANGTKIMGFQFSQNGGVVLNGSYSGGNSSTQNIDNVLIERCQFFESYVNFNNNYYHNDTVRNCLFSGNNGGNNATGIDLLGSGHTNIFIHNNIFDFPTILSGGPTYNLSTVFFRNNLIINKSTAVFSGIYNMVIENNIFYGGEPSGGTNCAFTKNITYLCSAVPGAGNVGSGNLNATNPMFVNYPAQGGAFLYTYDFHLQGGSPGKNVGTDGTDMGIYGGMLPYTVGANPHFPQMMVLTLPSGSSVPAGGTLNVHFQARKGN